MEKRDLYGEWVIFGGKRGEGETAVPLDEELLAAAREAWPHVLAHARRELTNKGLTADKTAQAAEVWERVLRSVSRTRQRSSNNRPPIADLQSYLIGAFHHRFNRLLRREQRRIDTIELVSFTVDLERLEGARNTQWVAELENAIAVKEVIGQMDEWTRRVWRARQYGYSWDDIAKRLGLSERHVRRKFRQGFERTRERIIEFLRKKKEKSKG